MRFPFRRRKQTQPAGAIVDGADLLARVERITPIIVEMASRAAMKDGKPTIPQELHKIGALVEKMTDEELAAFLDFAEASCPEEFKHLLR